MNWTIGREKYGKIRPGQMWKKRDIGRRMRVVHRNGDDCWTVCFESPAGGGNIGVKSHILKQRDIYKYYDRI